MPEKYVLSQGLLMYPGIYHGYDAEESQHRLGSHRL